MAGGVLGGAVINGHISVGQEIEIRPGYIIKRNTKQFNNKIKQNLKQCGQHNQYEQRLNH